MTKLIIFLIRKRLGLKKNEPFRFNNQKDGKDYYFFTDTQLMKVQYTEAGNPLSMRSHVSLNWIVDEDCSVEKIDISGEPKVVVVE